MIEATATCHISLTCHSHFYHIRDLRRIRRYIYLSVTKTIDTAVITTGSLFNLTLFSNSALLPIKLFLLENLHIYFHAFFSTQPREFRSSGFHLLSFPQVKTHTGTRAFSVAVPTLWNSLPDSSNSIVSFRHHLKTHLFRLADPS